MPRIQPPPEEPVEDVAGKVVDAPEGAPVAESRVAPVAGPPAGPAAAPPASAPGRPVRLSWGPGGGGGGIGGMTPPQVAVYAGAALGVLLLVVVTVAALGRRAPAATPAASTPLAAPAPTPAPDAAQPEPEPSPAPAPQTEAPAAPAPAVSDAARAQAVDLLGAAAAERQAGRLGPALDLSQQALAAWPDFADAAAFAADVAPQATATVQAAQAAQAAQATAQAQQRAQAAATAQAAAAARPNPGPAPAAPGAPAPAPAPGAPLPPPGRIAFGFQGEFFHAPTRSQAMAAITGAGFGWAKQQIRWEDYEIQAAECERDRGNCIEQAVNGRPKFFRKNRTEWLDVIVEDASANGVRLLISVVRAPEFYAAPGGHSPSDPQTLGDFLQFLVTRYKGKVHAIEPWNEQNLAWEWGARLWPNAPAAPPQGVVEFVRQQQAAYRGVKAADPSVSVVLPALTPTGLGECWLDPGGRASGGCVEQVQKAIDDRLYLDFLFQVNNGEIKQYYDVLGVHPSGYNNPPDDFTDQKSVASTTFKGHGSFYVRRYQQLREVQLKYGDNKPMWFTEVGWASTRQTIPGYEFGRDNSEAARGQYIARLLEQINADAPYVTGVFLWNLNFRTVVPESDEKFGFGLLNPDLSPTPGYTCAADFVKSGSRITRPDCRTA